MRTPVSRGREDGSRATFEVYKSEIYPKNDFPTKAVYQPTEGAELRLITCDGFTESSGEFVENLVIYAKLVDAQ
ncbi:sortase domain-containing protein [Arthrobacter sp. H14]|uniref:sortase domain-containing protein n=1 Tax=Arthrobacter sp. H14 TaxID=1312959 RepID=UPI0004B16DA4|nr:sortase [Arthrobacter sp. H14]